MHHLYPSLKGDQLCPLGFHPQTRYPTRCKRCFRDYKEHGGRRGGEDVAISSPNLSDGLNARPSSRSWTSTQNLSSSNGSGSSNDIELKKRPQSWASTPDIDEADDRTRGSSRNSVTLSRPVENNVDVTVKLPTPPRRHTTALDLKEVEDSSSQNRLSTTSSLSKSSSSPSRSIPDDLVILSTDSLAERVRKMQLLKKQRSLNSRENSRERSVPKKSDDEQNSASDAESKPPPDRPDRNKASLNLTTEQKRSSLPPKKTSSSSTSTSTSAATTRPASTPSTTSLSIATPKSDIRPAASTSTSASSSHTSSSTLSSSSARRKESEKQKATQDVEFMLKIKDTKYADKKPHDNNSLATETTETTLVASRDRELKDEIKSLRNELESMKTRAERAERDKSDILLRRLASMDTAPNRTAASEALMLQQKVNELKEQLDKVNEEKRKLNSRMKDLENGPKSAEYELRRKLQAAEQLCEELMEENQDVKKEIRNLEAEMDEMHDSFRDNQAEVNTTLQKQLEATTKNCRILSFKLKKCERKIDNMEQEKQSSYNEDMTLKVKKLEEELRFSNDLARKLQAEADELRFPGKKKAPMLGVLGKSTSADAKITRESLTRGGSQEDPQQLLRDLQDSVERESDLKDQLKFAEEEAENLRKKVARFEDENDSLMMQLKKMATRSRTRKLSPHRLAPEVQADRDEGISDEDDPAELRILLELNEQEASILRLKVDDLEKENSEAKKQVRELQERMRNDAFGGKKSSLLSLGGSSSASDKRVKALNDELSQLRKTLAEKDRTIEQLQAENNTKNSGKSLAKIGAGHDGSIDVKRQLDLVEQEAAILRSKITTLESENEKLLKENKRMQLQSLRKTTSTENVSNGEVIKLKASFAEVERERDELNVKLKRILQETDEKLPAHTPKRITDLTPKNHLKKWVEELEDEINEMRAMVVKSGAEKLKTLETEKTGLEEELQKMKQKLTIAESDIQKLKTTSNSAPKTSELEHKLKKSEEESKKLSTKIKDLEDKVKKQDNQIKQIENAKSSLETQTKRDKDKISTLEKDYEKERKEREKLESKLSQLDDELSASRKSAEKTKASLEKEIKELKSKSSNSKSDSKQVSDLKKQNDELQVLLDREKNSYADLNTHWEKLSEETILMRAQLTTERKNLQAELSTAQKKLSEFDTIRAERSEMAKKLKEVQKKLQDLEAKNVKNSTLEHEKTMLKNKLSEKEGEYERLRRENEMNLDLVSQLRKDNDDLNGKLNDFSRIEQAQSSINGHSASLESEIKALKIKLQNSELQLKSDVASTRLRYEQQVKNLNAELTSMQRQCEKFKKDRDTFKQMLESAQKKIGDLKANNTGRQSRGSMHSSDDDDKSKIAYLEQQVGCLEDQLVESRLEANKVKTELVSERSANEIKISEMQSKLNEFEEERVIGSGRTKIPGMKTKLELSWQKEREDQQRLLQETSTLARDLRQTLFEVERERDKERLESKRRLDQLKRGTEEEMEEGRRKIAELQCDLLELRDVHAKLRTSNEKLRRERERYEKELIKRRLEQDGGERKVGALLQSVDELVKIAPDLKIATSGAAIKASPSSGRSLRPETPNTRRSRSPSPTLTSQQIAGVLARLAEASEELRKFQRVSEDENERTRIKRGSLRRAASQENDPHGSTGSVASTTSQRNGSKLSRSSPHNGSLIRKSLSLDQTTKHDQNIWRQDDGSVSSIQSIDSELGGMVRDSSFDSRLDSRLSGGSTQSDIPRGPRKKKKGLMGKLRSLTKSSRNSESEVSIQGSDSDVSVASDMRASKKDLRGRLSGMFKRSGSTPRSASSERASSSSLVQQQRPVAVTVVGDPDGPEPREPPPANAVTPKPIRSISKPPTPTTPITKRRVAK